MERWFIDDCIQFKFYIRWGVRWWHVNDQRHRNDDGPAFENTKNGYCAWSEHGNFMRSNQ